MKKRIIRWLVSLLSGDDKKALFKAVYPDHHLRRNPRKQRTASENDRKRIQSTDEESSTITLTLPLAPAQIQGETV